MNDSHKHHLRAVAALPIHPTVMIIDRITLIEAKVAKNMQFWHPPRPITNRALLAKEVIQRLFSFTPILKSNDKAV